MQRHSSIKFIISRQ